MYGNHGAGLMWTLSPPQYFSLGTMLGQDTMSACALLMPKSASNCLM